LTTQPWASSMGAGGEVTTSSIGRWPRLLHKRNPLHSRRLSLGLRLRKSSAELEEKPAEQEESPAESEECCSEPAPEGDPHATEADECAASLVSSCITEALRAAEEAEEESAALCQAAAFVGDVFENVLTIALASELTKGVIDAAVHDVENELAGDDERTTASEVSVCDPSALQAAWNRRLSCEANGCSATFYLYGRHHCRACGKSICSNHFRRPFCFACSK